MSVNRNSLWTFVIALLKWIAVAASHQELRLSKWLTERQLGKSGQAFTETKLDHPFEQILAKPREYALTVGRAEYRDFVEDYFVLKIMTARFEAYHKSLPIQLFNEFRNALDHFVRSLLRLEIVPAEYEKRHLDKVRGHLQRATLDSLKLLCGFLDEDVERKHKRFSPRVIGKANSGEYIIEVYRLQADARHKFVVARCQEFALDGSRGDLDVLKLFFEAASAFQRVHQYQADHYRSLMWEDAKLPITAIFTSIVTFVSVILVEMFHHELADYLKDRLVNLFK